ncbi:hypothetical protein, partial [Dialister succinatiphilus]|uniref:hypothetical protein n=1 Tax=Dialister succinatiphilus TaxID=487173 RepID=UPI003F7E8E6E
AAFFMLSKGSTKTRMVSDLQPHLKRFSILPHRHFDRSGAEWRNLISPWYKPHYGERFPGSEP